jgi:hypothetical protein
VQFLAGIAALAAGIVSDEGVIFLFGETVVVFVVRTAMGECEGLTGIPPVESIVITDPALVIKTNRNNTRL